MLAYIDAILGELNISSLVLTSSELVHIAGCRNRCYFGSSTVCLWPCFCILLSPVQPECYFKKITVCFKDAVSFQVPSPIASVVLVHIQLRPTDKLGFFTISTMFNLKISELSIGYFSFLNIDSRPFLTGY